MQAYKNNRLMRLMLLFFIVLLFGCGYFQPKVNQEKKIVASVGEVLLNEENIMALIPPNISKNDSNTFVRKFIDDWVKKQLMISKAKETINFNEAEIQQKVLDYRYALMVHDFEKRYINQHLDTDILFGEVEAYYQEKSENFVLRQNIAKCMYFKIPLSAPNISIFRRNFRSYPRDSTAIIAYSNQFAVRSFTDSNLWVRFDEVLLETPLKDINNRTRFLQTNNLVETSDEDYIYFIKIFEYKLIGHIAPIEFVEESIEDIIINKRKIALVKALEKNIYEEAKASHAFEIYID